MADVNQKEENFIQLKKDNILKIGIKDSEGNDTGEHLEFDLEDIELPLKLNQCDAKHKKNLVDLQNREKIKALKEFYEKEMEALDLFLGKGGTKKLLNGRNPYISMYNDIAEIIEPILPKLKVRSEDIKNKIVSKYGKVQEENNVLK